MNGWTLARELFLVLAFMPFAYYAVAIVAARRFFGARHGRFASGGAPGEPACTRGVSILKPIRGLDRETYENYASFCRQDYPEFEILFCVSDDSDSAIPTIEKIIRDFPERQIRLLVGSEPLGASDKVNKLCRMTREARYGVILVSDSDVRVAPNFLCEVVASFRDPKVGGVTCLYRGITDGSFAADLEALGNSADFAPGVLVAQSLGDLDFMLGAVMVTTKKHLAEIGGFESLVDYFCDDYELGNRIATRGYRIELSRTPVDVVYPRESFAGAFRHQVRWNLSIRCSRPWGHFGLLFTQGLTWAIAGMLVARSWPLTVAFAACYCLLRYEVAIAVGARGMDDGLVRRKLRLLPLRDAFAFLVWLASFFPQRIRWRDQQFRVRDKRLVPLPSATSRLARL